MKYRSDGSWSDPTPEDAEILMKAFGFDRPAKSVKKAKKRQSSEPLVTREQAEELEEWYART